MDGCLNIYFPGQLRNSGLIRRWCSKWRRVRKRQLRQLHNQHRPLSDLLDNKEIREENDRLLNQLRSMFVSDNRYLTSSPYATYCLCVDYQEQRESKIHSKELSCVLSCFTVNIGNTHGNIKGILMFNLNVDSQVGCFILSLNFTGLTVDDIIRLKHCFYKRFLVNITKRKMNGELAESPCAFTDPFSCLSDFDATVGEPVETTFQDFVYRHLPVSIRNVKCEFDFRARYSFLEIKTEKADKDKTELYGLLLADEGRGYVPQETVDRLFAESHTVRTTYQLYFYLTNALMITNDCNNRKCEQLKKKFFDNLSVSNSHVDIVDRLHHNCIAGMGKQKYPSFLKSVELHYLTLPISCIPMT